MASDVTATQSLPIGQLRIQPPVLMAPMAGFTDFAFRAIVRHFGGCGLLVTEMVSAREFFHRGQRRKDLPERLWGVADEARPLAVQLWDNDPGLLAEVAGALVERLRVSVIDLNFGCPAPDVATKAQSGAYLLQYPDRIGQIVARVAAACAPTPVTAKIRLGVSHKAITAVEVAQAIEDAGGAAVTVHGRTADQMYRGKADWERIAEIKQHLRRIPLVGNGDLRTPADVLAAFHRYGVDGVMIGRAALGRPWLFRQIEAALAGRPIPAEPSAAEKRELLLEHLRLLIERYGPKLGTVMMRPAAVRYGQGLPGARIFRAQVSRASNPQQFAELVEQYFPRHDGQAQYADQPH